MLKDTNMNEENKESKSVYLSIDHLKDGNYRFNFILNNKVIKSIKLKK
jgi:hypothetical protein